MAVADVIPGPNVTRRGVYRNDRSPIDWRDINRPRAVDASDVDSPGPMNCGLIGSSYVNRPGMLSSLYAASPYQGTSPRAANQTRIWGVLSHVSGAAHDLGRRGDFRSEGKGSHS